MLPRHNTQRDLFEMDQRIQAIPSSLRREIVRLIESLLAEAVGARGAETQSEDRATKTKEDAHEQDHA
jgi:hypothetical protein